MKKIIVILILILVGCNKTPKKQDSILHYVPKDAPIIIKINNIQKAASDLQNNDFIKKNSKLAIINYFEHIPKIKLHSDALESLLCLSPVGKDEFGYTFITKFDSKQLETDSLKSSSITKEVYNKKAFHKITRDEDSFYAAHIDSILIATSSRLLMENALRQHIDKTNGKHSIPKGLERAYEATSNENTSSILMNGQELKKISSLLLPNMVLENLSSIGEWIAVDPTVDQNELYLDGVAIIKDSVPSIIGIFNKTLPQENKIAGITPVEAGGFTSYTYDDFEILKHNLAFFQDRITKDMPTTIDGLLSAASEIGTITMKKNRALVIVLIDEEMSIENLINQEQKTYTYRGVPIYKFEDIALFNNILYPLVHDFEAKYFCALDGYIVLGDTQDALQNIITNYKNGSVLSESAGYQKISEHLTDQSSMLSVGNISHIKSIIADGVAKKHQSSWQKLSTDNYPLAAIQLINENNFAHLHAALQKNSHKGASKSVTQIAATTLDHELLNTPKLVKNHRTKGMDIVVQDINNQLYLISEKGNILWKKQLDGSILGKISQIDIYKNGRLQLIFNTEHTLYLLDRNGNEVKPYPKKFNDPITQPLAVFDYDKNKRYRVIVTQGNKISMYDANGKAVRGFEFKGAKSDLLLPPKHIRLGSKDYILFAEKEGTLSIIDRIGRPRVNVSKKIDFSDNKWFGYKNGFVSTNTDGVFIEISQKGKVTTSDLKLDKSGSIVATSKTLVTLSENKLTIKGNMIALDFGSYGKPEIFYINDKIYVSVTDIEAKKVYLYDSNGILFPNFPVYGSSVMSLGNIDKDSALEFTVQGEGNSILIYEIN